MALSAAASRKTRNNTAQSVVSIAVGTSATVYKGGLVVTLNSTGRLHAATVATARKFAGIAEETVSGNAGGTNLCKVSYGHEVFLPAATALNTARVGSDCYISADDLVTTATGAGTAALRVSVGEVVERETTGAWVRLRNRSGAVI